MKKIVAIGALFASAGVFAQCDINNAINAWTDVREDVATQMDVTAPGLNGTACKLTVNSTSDNSDRARVQDKSPECETSFRAHFLFNTDALGTLAGNERTKLYNVQCDPGVQSCDGVGMVQLRLQGADGGTGAHILRSFVADANEPDLRSRFDVPVNAGDNSIEIQWVRASSSGASDGVFRAWYPGNTTEASPSFEVTNLNNFGYCVNQVNLGLIKATNAWTTSKAGLDVIVDEYESRRQTAISLN